MYNERTPAIIPFHHYQPQTRGFRTGTIYQWDALALLGALPDNSVDVIWASPPYNLADPFRPGRPKKPGKPLKKYRYADSPGQGDGWHMPEAEYQARQIQVLNEWARVLKPEGVGFYSHRPRRVDWALQHPAVWIDKSRIVALQEVVWWHNGTQNRDERGFWFEHETIIVVSPTAGPRLLNLEPQPGGRKGLGDVWYIARDGKARQQWEHPATAHPQVVRHCLAAVPEQEGKIVVDCYAGVGTTAIVARDMGFQWVLGEISITYCLTAQERIGGTLF